MGPNVKINGPIPISAQGSSSEPIPSTPVQYRSIKAVFVLTFFSFGIV